MGVVGLAYIVVTQIRINSINVYSGSLALSNFAARVFAFRPGRQYWLAALIIAGSLLTVANVYAHLLAVLTFESVFVVGWVMSVVGFLVAQRIWRQPAAPWLGRFASLDKYSHEGPIALILAVALSTPMAFGVLGDTGKGWAPVVSGSVAFCISFALARK
jgi:hypothetical protein